MALLLSGEPVLAQDRVAPFETITVAVEAFSDAYDGRLQEFWDPQPGAGVSLETPFYLGRISLGIARFSYSARQANLPEFTATYIALGWGIGCRMPLNLQWQNGISVGSFRMSFDDEQTESATRNEQELALGLRSSLQCPLGKRWSLDFSGQYLAVMTHVRIQHLLVSVGISRSFTTPQWLEDFLR